MTDETKAPEPETKDATTAAKPLEPARPSESVRAAKAAKRVPALARKPDGSIASRADPERGEEVHADKGIYSDPFEALEAAGPRGEVRSSRERAETVRDEDGVTPVRDPRSGRIRQRLVAVTFATDAGEKFVVEADETREGWLPARKICG